MISYILRRLLYALPLLMAVNVLTFLLFFVVNSPDDMARMQLGQKHVTEQAIQNWKQQHGYDKPLLWNTDAPTSDKFTQTIFYSKSVRLMLFRFGISDSGRNIGADIQERAIPSLALALPTLLIGLVVNVCAALLMVLFRRRTFEQIGIILCVMLMSISSLFYIISGQFLVAKVLKLVPISGYDDGFAMIKFLILPVLIGIFTGIGSGMRWYQTLFLEEVEKDYVRTARAKGLTETQTLFRHVLPNAMIPILTGVVVILPIFVIYCVIRQASVRCIRIPL